MRNRLLTRAVTPFSSPAVTPANPETAGKSGTFRLLLFLQTSYTERKPPSCPAYVTGLYRPAIGRVSRGRHAL